MRKGLIGLLAAAVVLGCIFGIKELKVWRAGHTWNLPLAGRVIVVDAGHGGEDGGAARGTVIEKEITLAIAQDLRDYLQQDGALVVMTRDSDIDLADEDYEGRHKRQDLLRRADLIEKIHPDAFISVHLNAIPSQRWRGAQTFYHPKSAENRRFARLIQQSLKKNLGNTERYAKPIGHVFLLKQASPPAALVEVGFLSNPDERALLIRDTYQKKAAAAIVQGIMRFFTNERVPSH
ncbi:MAG: N-acetylmuramoyl-L-alanine amidase CwlD [Sporolactobacillus sp.]|nr:N-acetylmuramoyl-L-alanine amidase CwlD [Sporolactobacillus sp.]